MNRSKPYFFSFNDVTKDKATGHFVVIESLNMPREQFEGSQFTLFPADYDQDKRLRDLVHSAHWFYENNLRPPFPEVMGKPITREEIIGGLRDGYKSAVELENQKHPGTVGFPDMLKVLDYIEKHGLPAANKKASQ